MDVLRLLRSKFDNTLNRRLPRHRLEAKRLRRFRRLAAYARRHSPFYARLMDEAGIDADNCRPQDFPVLTKRMVMDHFDDIVTERGITRAGIEEFLETSSNPLDLFRGRYYVIHTSGSSGEVGFYVYSPADMACGIARGPRPPHRFLRKTRLAFFGATKGHFAGVTFISTIRRSPLKYVYQAETFEINSPLQQVIQGLNSYRPDVLAGYGTGLKILADQKLEGRLLIEPELLVSSGEPLNRPDREKIEEVFEAPVLNCYMCTEHVYMGISMPEDSGMYLLEDDLIFECHEGHTYVTNLSNFTQPLIRYRMEDVLVPIKDRDGRLPYTKVKEVVGRNEYVPYFTNRHGVEDFISPHIINEFFVKHVKRFQMQVEGKKSFEFKVMTEQGLLEGARLAMLEEIRARLGEILAAKDMDNVSFRISEVDELPVDKKTGKFKLILPPG